jgi:iron-sulfur cluster repair protein YtfE (RIC family)
MDAVALLERQHAQIIDLIDELRQAVEAERADVLGMLATELVVHMALEEFYVDELTPGFVSSAKRNDALDEHHRLRARLLDLLRRPASDADFPSKLSSLEGDFRRHMGDEEAEYFPILRERVGGEVLRDLARKMEKLSQRLHREGELEWHLLDGVPAPSRDPNERPHA